MSNVTSEDILKLSGGGKCLSGGEKTIVSKWRWRSSKNRIKPLKETNLGVAQDFMWPLRNRSLFIALGGRRALGVITWFLGEQKEDQS